MERCGLILGSLAAVACWCADTAQAAHFVPPAEGPVPFHRDRLPIDVNAMTTLSRQLVTIAGAQEKEEMASLQTMARLLALAQALDPQNREADDMEARLKDNRRLEAADEKDVARAVNRAWQIQSWLASESAGAEGKALADCLLDVLSAVDPENPKAASSAKEGAHGAWAGWVAPLSEFEDKTVVKNETPAPKVDEHPATKPTTEGQQPVGVSIRLKQAMVHTPLWVFDQNAQKASLKLVAVKINAWSESQAPSAPRKMEVRFQNSSNPDRMREGSEQVMMAVKAIHGAWPQAGKADVSIGNGIEYLVQRNHNLISAAEAVLVDATLSGQEPDATVIGLVGADGSFSAPPRFWDLLRSLADGPGGGRLVIPRACAPVMLSVLAMEDPGFFFKYEVISASNLKELAARCAKRSAPDLDEASAKFQEIREKLGNSQVGAFVANRFVRQRLAELAQAYPDHLSAKMLAIQGTGERPTRIPRPILAAELRKAVQPAFLYAGKTYDQIDLAALESTYDGCRKSIEALARYEETRDRALADRANEMLASMRSFLRAKRTVRSATEQWKIEQMGRNAFDVMVKSIISYQRELMLELGEQPQENRQG